MRWLCWCREQVCDRLSVNVGWSAPGADPRLNQSEPEVWVGEGPRRGKVASIGDRFQPVVHQSNRRPIEMHNLSHCELRGDHDNESLGSAGAGQPAVAHGDNVRANSYRSAEMDGVVSTKPVLMGEICGITNEVVIDFDDVDLRPQFVKPELGFVHFIHSDSVRPVCSGQRGACLHECE